MDSTRTFLLVIGAICLAHSSLAEGKRGRKLEETESFDVKPSGQLSHQRIDLVSTICVLLGGCTAINLLVYIQENGVTCLFTYAAVGGTNEVTTRCYDEGS